LINITPENILLYAVTAVQAMLLLVAVYNYYTVPAAEIKPGMTGTPELNLSVLIPARNEETNIGRCLDSLLKQNYKNYEVIILDDNSEDKTAEIATRFVNNDKRFTLLKGNILPGGWLGKNYACHQLYKAAKFNHLLFIDADVILKENALKSAVWLFSNKQAGMLSLFPTQIITGITAYFIVPLMNWILLSFLPLKKVYSSPDKKYIAANGQFILINKDVYEQSGGHLSIKNEIVEDMELAKNVKQKGFRVVTGVGGNNVYCKMYNNFSESFTGFAKNFYPGFKINRQLFYMLLILIQLLFLFPFIAVFFNTAYIIPVFLILGQRMLISIISRQPLIINLIFHPVQMFVLFITGIFSSAAAGTNKLTWKGRHI
jgi:chlorobactene glucosyltransferase